MPRAVTSIIVAVFISLCLCCSPARSISGESEGNLPENIHRTWLGPEYWANRLHDWQLANGRIECIEKDKNKPMRTVHLLTKRLAPKKGDLKMSVLTSLIGDPTNLSDQAATGFLLGAGPDLDYRAAALIHHSAGPGAGIFAGIDASGTLFIRDWAKGARGIDLAKTSTDLPLSGAISLELSAQPAGEIYSITLAAKSLDQPHKAAKVTYEGLPPEKLIGNLALVSNPGRGDNTASFWFKNWQVSGSKLEVHPDRLAGPILSTKYTLSNNILKLSAQMMPIGPDDTQKAKLQTKSGADWKTIATADIIAPGYTATFRVPNWDSTEDTPYRAVYNLKIAGGKTQTCTWSGTIRPDPVDKPVIVVAGFTGNHNIASPGADAGRYAWTPENVWFPHAEVTYHVAKQNPDLLFFSGDQVYENASPTAPVRGPLEKAMLDYMYKWYLWCWAYRDLTKDLPSVCIPDDHDVYQGNLWGAGGRKTDKDDKGGYVYDAEFIKMVDRTQTSNLPDPYDPTPIHQGIGVYYCPLNYGRVSFAVLEDRKFKSGPNGLVPPTKSGRADHVIDPNYDISKLDVPGAKLLGDRQLKFLADWAADWHNTDFKVALSQTIFAALATHHGPELTYLVADLDSNAWPQTGRNKALRQLRKGFAFMIGGDQHLATICHHGIDNFDDAGWSMCVPSVANYYPRAWNPQKKGLNRQPGTPEYTGQYLDGLGNHVTVWAATNPGKSTGVEPARLHDRMPGYGIVRFNKTGRTITIECWPRYADPTDPAAKQYEGWPRTITQLDNYARKPYGYLPTVEVSGMRDPVVQVINEASREIVYTIRIKGASFEPKVFKDGTYTLNVGELGTERATTYKGLKPAKERNAETLKLEL